MRQRAGNHGARAGGVQPFPWIVTSGLELVHLGPAVAQQPRPSQPTVLSVILSLVTVSVGTVGDPGLLAPSTVASAVNM